MLPTLPVPCKVRQRKLKEKDDNKEKNEKKNDTPISCLATSPSPLTSLRIEGAGPGSADRPSEPDARRVAIASAESDDGETAPGKEEELTKHTPEVRTAIYRELAEQKSEKEARQRENMPRERDFEREQVRALVFALASHCVALHCIAVIGGVT